MDKGEWSGYGEPMDVEESHYAVGLVTTTPNLQQAAKIVDLSLIHI